MGKTLQNILERVKKKGKLLLATGIIAGASLFAGCELYNSSPVESPQPTSTMTQGQTSPKPTKTKTPTPIDYVDISGQVVGEAGEGEKSNIKIYDASDPNVIARNFSATSPLKECSTNYNGNFSVTLNKSVSELPNGVVVRTATGQNWENKTSYVDTKTLSQGDHANVKIYPTMFDSPLSYDDGLLDTLQKRENYIEHVGRENVYSKNEREAIGIEGFVNGNRDHGLKKWNQGELSDTSAHPTFKGFKIDTTQFSETDQNQIIDIIRTSNFPGANEIQVLKEANPIATNGWVPIYHSAQGEGPYASLYDISGNDGYLERAKAYINTIAPSVLRHEIYHSLGCAGHSNGQSTPALYSSIGDYTAAVSNFESADIKTCYVISKNIGMKSLRDMLSLN